MYEYIAQDQREMTSRTKCLIVTIRVCYFDPTGVVGWCECVLFLASPGRPTYFGLQLGKACYPCSK